MGDKMNLGSKTLVILTPAFPANEMETVWVTPKQVFIRALSQTFPSLKIILLSFQYPSTGKEYEWGHHRVIPFNGNGRGKIHRVLLWWRVWRKLKQINKEADIVGLFSFWCGECALVGKWWGKRYGIRHFTWISGQDARKGNQYTKLIRPRPEELVAMSDFLAREFAANHGVRPAYTIPIGVDPGLFDPVPVVKDIDVLGAGSLLPLKQYDLFIKIVLQLTDRLPSLQALLCGGGPEEKKLKKMICDLHLEGNVIIKGETPHGEVLKLMQRCKVFLHPSSYEGFGAVCIEALYAGAQVVSFSQPMEAWINHWYVVKTPEEMFEKALELLLDPHKGQEPVLAYRMEDSARAVMALFGYEGQDKL
jgi:glycosyltransferase involved in cell wall biosynthesis